MYHIASLTIVSILVEDAFVLVSLHFCNLCASTAVSRSPRDRPNALCVFLLKAMSERLQFVAMPTFEGRGGVRHGLGDVVNFPLMKPGGDSLHVTAKLVASGVHRITPGTVVSVSGDGVE